MANVFLDFLKEKNIPTPVIFFVDGHKSHLSLQVGELCKKEGIILIAIPPNATHIMQPLDVSFFAPLKKKWRWYLEQHKLKNRKTTIEKQDVTVLLNDILISENKFRSFWIPFQCECS